MSTRTHAGPSYRTRPRNGGDARARGDVQVTEYVNAWRADTNIPFGTRRPTPEVAPAGTGLTTFTWEDEIRRMIANPHLYDHTQHTQALAILGRYTYAAHAASSEWSTYDDMFVAALTAFAPDRVSYDCETCGTAVIARNFTDPCPTCGTA